MDVAGSCQWVKTVYVAVYGGKPVKIKVLYYQINLEGEEDCCEAFEKKLMHWLDTLDRDSILDNVEYRLFRRERNTLAAWRAVQKQTGPVTSPERKETAKT